MACCSNIDMSWNYSKKGIFSCGVNNFSQKSFQYFFRFVCMVQGHNSDYWNIEVTNNYWVSTDNKKEEFVKNISNLKSTVFYFLWPLTFSLDVLLKVVISLCDYFWRASTSKIQACVGQ